MEPRPDQKGYGFDAEAPYPEHRTVVWSFRFPDMTCHLKSGRCKIEEPHKISECGEFDVSQPEETHA